MVGVPFVMCAEIPFSTFDRKLHIFRELAYRIVIPFIVIITNVPTISSRMKWFYPWEQMQNENNIQRNHHDSFLLR